MRLIPEPLLAATIDYLANRPYREVAQAIAELSALEFAPDVPQQPADTTEPDAPAA